MENKQGLPIGSIWVVFKMRVPFRVVIIRVPYYIGDLKRDPNLESYPYSSYRSFRKLRGYLILGVLYNKDPTI